MLEQLFDLLLGKRLKRLFLEFGSRDKLHGIGEFEFHAGPSEKSRETHPDVANSLWGEGGSIPVESSRLLLHPQPDEEGPEVFSCYFYYFFVPRMPQPLFPIIRITTQSCST